MKEPREVKYMPKSHRG